MTGSGDLRSTRNGSLAMAWSLLLTPWTVAFIVYVTFPYLPMYELGTFSVGENYVIELRHGFMLYICVVKVIGFTS